MSRRIPRAAFRVAAVFVVVLGLFGITLAVTLHTFHGFSIAEQQVAALDDAKHAGHGVAGLVREEYIHQAHSIIAWDHSHLAHYVKHANEARVATARLQLLALTDEERTQARRIAGIVDTVDQIFLTKTVPAIDANDHEQVGIQHARTAALVNEAVRISHALNGQLETRADAARRAADHLRLRAATIVVVCFSVAILVTAGGWFVILQSVLKRLEQLQKGAFQLASGDLGARVEVGGSDELSALATMFNEMAASVDKHQRKLMHAERLAALGQIAAGVAHEINNPLGVILGYVTLLRRTAERPAKDEEGLRIIEDETRQGQRIVRALLELGRPSENVRAPTDLAELARDAAERLTETEQAGVGTIIGPSPGSPVIVSADSAALRQVVSNLLMNALEASKEGGSIEMNVRNGGEYAELEVRDHGAGISSEAAPKIFDPFFTTKRTGTGLGLSICQAVVSAHDGTLEVHSEQGQGTRAVLRLPLARSRATEDR
jgi:two-component system NtrC family sensor kinase